MENWKISGKILSSAQFGWIAEWEKICSVVNAINCNILNGFCFRFCPKKSGMGGEIGSLIHFVNGVLGLRRLTLDRKSDPEKKAKVDSATSAGM